MGDNQIKQGCFTLLFLLCLLASEHSYSHANVVYSGTETEAASATSSGYSQGSSSISADINLRYVIPKTVSISVFNENGSPSSLNAFQNLPFLTSFQNRFEAEAQINDIVATSNTSTFLDYLVVGWVFSNTAQNVNFIMSANNGSAGDKVIFTNGSDTVESRFIAQVVGTPVFELGDLINPPLPYNNRNLFIFGCDIDEGTVEPTDSPGDYFATITIQVTAP